MKTTNEKYEYDPRVVPDDPKHNAIWRAETLRMAENSARWQDLFLDKCGRDIWYWLKGFVYVYEPRMRRDQNGRVLSKKIPFLPWKHQVPFIDAVNKYLGQTDIRVLKSRAQGATWMVLLIFLHRWLFERGFKGNLVSKDEKSVDARRDPDSLMWKIDWELEQLPGWMAGRKRIEYERNTSDHTLYNLRNEAALRGYACTGNMGAGGRATAFLMDEFARHPRGPDTEALASTQAITDCRIFLSTPLGADGAYYEVIKDETSDAPLLYLKWEENETQNRGLYKVVQGKPVCVNEKKYGALPVHYYNLGKWRRIRNRLEERGYVVKDGLRSPWYDTECLRPGATPHLIAQELDRDFSKSVARYFTDSLIERLMLHAVRRAVRGEFHVYSETCTGNWVKNPDGRLYLWFKPDFMDSPPSGRYAVGVDVASGVPGGMNSNSVISVVNAKTGLKVAGFASPSILPYRLAELAVALCYWFGTRDGHPAYLVWEANGYGREFGLRVQESGFTYYYMRSTRDSPIRGPKTKKAGYWTRKRSELLGPYREALLEGFFETHDKAAIEELRAYRMGTDGEPYHPGEKAKSDPSGAGYAHGDRVIADALAWLGCQEIGAQAATKRRREAQNVMNVSEEAVPRQSAAYRRAKYLRAKNAARIQSTW